MATPVPHVAVDLLDLDEQNPRLPEDVQGGTQGALLAYLEQNDVLEELAASFVANGYFANEPIVALPPDDEGRRVVVEGNRRVAALMVLLQLPPAVEAELDFDLNPQPSKERLASLGQIPYTEVADPQELRAYLGYRHISGLRRWSPEAKARYISQAVDEAVANGSDAPFYDVGRLMGSNARGVRSAYTAYQVLRRAREETGLDVRALLKDRFGVWSRLLTTAHVPSYINLSGGAREYDEVVRSLLQVDQERLAHVVADLTPREGVPAVLNDSRDVTRYSEVIGDDAARATLREYRDLDLAYQTVAGKDLRARIEELTRSCDVLVREARRLQVDQPAVDAADDLAAAADNFAAILRRGLTRVKSGGNN